MDEKEFIPDGPYVFQSGKRVGKSAELLMFRDYSFVDWYLKTLNQKMGGKMNLLHQHIAWLVGQGENRTAKALCQQCGHDSPIRIFSAWGNDCFGYSIGLPYTCCGRQECLESIEMQSNGKPLFLPLKFSSIIHFWKKADQQSVVRLLRRVHHLPERLTKKAAFRFFSEP